MSKRDLDEYEGTPLSEHENKYARMMMDRDKRITWFWGSAYRLGIAVGALAAAISAFFTLFSRFRG